MDPRYTYLNAVLDANPEVVRLALDDRPISGTIPSDYSVATGPVPAGQQSIPDRVTLESKSEPLNPFAAGYNSAGELIVQFGTT